MTSAVLLYHSVSESPSDVMPTTGAPEKRNPHDLAVPNA